MKINSVTGSVGTVTTVYMRLRQHLQYLFQARSNNSLGCVLSLTSDEKLVYTLMLKVPSTSKDELFTLPLAVMHNIW